MIWMKSEKDFLQTHHIMILNDIEIESTSLEEFLNDIQKPSVKFTTRGGIDELRERVAYEI